MKSSILGPPQILPSASSAILESMLEPGESPISCLRSDRDEQLALIATNRRLIKVLKSIDKSVTIDLLDVRRIEFN